MYIPTSLLGPCVTATDILLPYRYVHVYIYIHTFSLDSSEQTTAMCELCTPTDVSMYALGKTAVTKMRRLIGRRCVIRKGKRGGGGGSPVNI